MAMNIADLQDGDRLGTSEWVEITQAIVDQFANATNDHQWIHVDPQRCAKESPFKTTIAHGLLSTALMPSLFYKLIDLDDSKHTLLNYGMDSVRYLEPVRVGDSIRYHVVLDSKEQKSSGVLYRFNTSVEILNRDKPAMVGTFLMLLVSA